MNPSNSSKSNKSNTKTAKSVKSTGTKTASTQYAGKPANTPVNAWSDTGTTSTKKKGDCSDC